MSNNQFRLDTRGSNASGGKLLNITAAKYEGDWHSTLHTHHFSEFFYIKQGLGKFIVGGDVFDVAQDDLVIINPNVEHTEMSKNAQPLEYLVLGIEGISFSFAQPARMQEEGYCVYNCSTYRNELLFYLLALLDEAEKRAPDYEAVCQNLLEVLLIKTMRHTNFSLSIASARRTNKECGDIKRYIDTYYKDPITLGSLAERTHMNKYYLVHAFQKFMGVSPISYLISRRIEESKSLLESTSYSIAQISGIIGFSSQSYFAQLFKKNTGETPNGYRKRVKGGTGCAS